MAVVSVQRATSILEAFLSPKADPRMWALWGGLPEGLDRRLVAKAMAAAMTDGHTARAVGRRLNESYFDLYEAELKKHPRWPETVVTLALPSDVRRASVGEMFRKMRLLMNGAVDERVRLFAKDPLFVTVVTAMVASAELDWNSFRAFVSVLLEAATPDALDVVLPHVERVIQTRGPELDMLRWLVKRRKSPALAQLRDLLENVAAERPGPAARDRLINALKLPPLKRPLAWQWSSLGQRDQTTLSAAMYVSFDIEPWFKLRVSESLGQSWTETVVTSRGTDRNQLELPPLTDFFEFPQWFRAVKKKLGGTWDAGACTHPAPRAAVRELIEGWLNSSQAAK